MQLQIWFFSQPFSTVDQVAAMILKCASSKKFEIVSGGFFTRTLTNVAYLFPCIKKILTPLMQAKGRKTREYLRKKHD